MTRSGRVFQDEIHAGWIEETETGMRFWYEPAWLASSEPRPISLTLPLSPEVIESRGIHPFFAGLLPEGWLLEISTAALKISPDDAFGLLLALCRDCVGAVRILPPEGPE